MKFPDYEAFEVVDSRGVPTIGFRADYNGETVVSKVPGGTSVSPYEAHVLPVPDALKQAQELKKLLVGSTFDTLNDFDQNLIKEDGTANKERLGGNTILGLSMLFCRLAALSANQELFVWLRANYEQGPKRVPSGHRVTPQMVMIEGGQHAESGPIFQETLLNAPTKAGLAVWKQLDRQGYALGMEGGFDIPFHNRALANEQALAKLRQAVAAAAVTASLSVDCASEGVEAADSSSVADINRLITDWQLESVEDPFKSDEWDKWQQLVREVIGHRFGTAIVGDDLTATNTGRLSEALEKKAVTGVIVKPNQVGSVSETLSFVRLAQKGLCTIIVSHRSGETDDTFIADLAYAVFADFLKAGAPNKPERRVKYERLAQIQGQA